MAFASGVHEWDGKEIDEKIAAEKVGAARRLAHVVSSAVADEFEIVVTDGDTQEAEWSYLVNAQNHLLSQLNFPNKLKPFLDTILGSACGLLDREFTATNLEIGQKSRSGRDACSDNSMEKWVSRQKQGLEDWMAFKSFHLVKITPGEYDQEKKRSRPTRYQVFFNEYVVKAVNLAKAKWYWSGGDDSRLRRNRAIREAARQTINEIPDAPPFKLRPAKTLSEEEKFDRRHNSILTFLTKNRDALSKVGFETRDYFLYLVGEVDKIATNPSGGIGQLLTPERDEPNRHFSVWQKIKTGEIVEEIEKSDKNLTEKLEILGEVGFNQVEYAYRSNPDIVKQSASDNYSEGNSTNFNNSAKPLETLNESRGTFFPDQGDIFVRVDAEKMDSVKQSRGTNLSGRSDAEPDFTDWFNDAADVETENKLNLDVLRQIVQDWAHLVDSKMPKAAPSELAKGVWQIYWDEQFDQKSILLEADMAMMPRLIAKGEKPLSALKPMFVEWIMSRVTYYQSGVPQRGYGQDSRYKQFKAKLNDFLKLPEGFDDG